MGWLRRRLPFSRCVFFTSWGGSFPGLARATSSGPSLRKHASTNQRAGWMWRRWRHREWLRFCYWSIFELFCGRLIQFIKEEEEDEEENILLFYHLAYKCWWDKESLSELCKIEKCNELISENDGDHDTECKVKRKIIKVNSIIDYTRAEMIPQLFSSFSSKNAKYFLFTASQIWRFSFLSFIWYILKIFGFWVVTGTK